MGSVSGKALALQSIKKNEGLRQAAYLDTEEVLTIGYGFALARLEVEEYEVSPAVKGKAGIDAKRNKSGKITAKAVPPIKGKAAVMGHRVKVTPIQSLRKELCLAMVETRLNQALREAGEVVKGISGLSEIRQSVLFEMAYQLGKNGLASFVKTLALIEKGKFEEAAEEGMRSKWAEQTPERAARLMARLEEG